MKKQSGKQEILWFTLREATLLDVGAMTLRQDSAVQAFRQKVVSATEAWGERMYPINGTDKPELVDGIRIYPMSQKSIVCASQRLVSKNQAVVPVGLEYAEREIVKTLARAMQQQADSISIDRIDRRCYSIPLYDIASLPQLLTLQKERLDLAQNLITAITDSAADNDNKAPASYGKIIDQELPPPVLITPLLG